MRRGRPLSQPPAAATSSPFMRASFRCGGVDLLNSKPMLRFEKDVSPESFRCWTIRPTPDIPANKNASAASSSGDGAWQYLFRRGIPARNVSCPLSPRSCFHPRFQVSRLGIILPERLPIPHGRQWLCSFVRFTVTGIVRNSHPLPSMLSHRRISAENPVNIWIVV